MIFWCVRFIALPTQANYFRIMTKNLKLTLTEVILFFWVFVFILVVLDQCSYGGLSIMFMNVRSIIWMEMHIFLIKQNLLLSARSGQFLWVVNIFCDGRYIYPLFLRVDLFSWKCWYVSRYLCLFFISILSWNRVFETVAPLIGRYFRFMQWFDEVKRLERGITLNSVCLRLEIMVHLRM